MNNKLSLSIFASFGAVFFLSFSTNSVLQDRWTAPAEADTLKSPFAPSPEVIRKGENLFNTYCVSCHGKTGLGDGSPGKYPLEPANFHSKVVTDQTDGALFWKMSKGRGVMPAYAASFSEEQRWQLVAYIRQLPRLFNAQSGLPKGKVLLPSNYKINAKTSTVYFPLPAKVKNVVNSESQLFMVDTVVKGLNRPWSMVFLPDKRVLIAERGGKLRVVKNGRLQSVSIGGNVPFGLRDIKLHPKFEQNHIVYISYYIEPVKPDGGYTVLLRGRLEGDKLVDEKIIYKAGLKLDGEWYGSRIALDKTGHVFLTVGIHHTRKNAQVLSSVEGKTMRLNYDGSIPSDNPFINTPGALPEIYSYGHRVNEGIEYDPKTGNIFSTEFGELGGDELNIIKPGRNYGWPIVTYSLEYNGSIISKSPFLEGMEPPVYHFAIAPSNLTFVYGDQYPAWNGNVFIGGLAAKSLLRVAMKDNVVTHEETLLETIGRIRDVKYGPDQFLYVMTEDSGVIVRLVPLKKNN
jgi:glucose/arabinose dehydrogenase/mono/diheme cytochrome c family protein